MSNPSALGPLRSRNLPNTASPVGNRWAGDVVAHMGVELLATDAVVMGSTSTITGSLTTAQVGDVIFFTSGSLSKTQYSISEVSGTTITVAQDMAVAPTGGDTYNIYRFRPIVLNSSGAITATISGAVDTELPPAAALTDGESASTAVPEVGARMMGFNGTTWDRAQLAEVRTSDAGASAKGVITRLSAEDFARIGIVTETAPGTDTASSGLNGRLQRIAQRLTSILTALSDKTQFTKITDGTDTAEVEAAGTFNTGLANTTKGLTANARLHQIWDSTHPDNNGAGADGNYYAQNQDPNGNVCTNISSIRGHLLRFRDTAAAGFVSGGNPPPLPVGGYGNSSAPSAVTAGRAVDRWHDLNGRGAVFADAGAFADGALATLGLKADAKSTATDTTAVTIMQVLKQISASVQAPIAAKSRQTFTNAPKAFTATTSVTQITAADATYGYDICSITLENNSATDSEFILYADDGTTEVWRGTAKANDMRGISFPAGREVTQGAINKQWKGKTVTSVSSVYVTLQYVKTTAWAI